MPAGSIQLSRPDMTLYSSSRSRPHLVARHCLRKLFDDVTLVDTMCRPRCATFYFKIQHGPFPTTFYDTYPGVTVLSCTGTAAVVVRIERTHMHVTIDC